MKPVLSIVACVLWCAHSHADAEKGGTEANLPAFTMSSEVPESALAAHTPYRNPHPPQVKSGIDETILQREVDYTWDWMEKLLNKEFVPNVTNCNVQPLYGIGPRGDDGILLKWQAKGYMLEMLDSRTLSLVVRKAGLGDTDVEEAFKTLIHYDRYDDRQGLRVSTIGLGWINSGVSYGQIMVKRRDARRGWLLCPIGWYKERDTLLLVFDKVLRPPESKIPVRDETQYIGGTSWDDERPFLRFENSNRSQLAAEFFKTAIPPEPVPPGFENTIKGRAVLPLTGLE